MLQTTALVGYISEFSRDQFRRRFQIPESVTEAVVLLSTDPNEYAQKKCEFLPPMNADKNLSKYVLIVGNHYSHKHIRETVAAFRKQESCPPLIVLGMELEKNDGLISYRAGELETELVEGLYENAGIVLFPSHYRAVQRSCATATESDVQHALREATVLLRGGILKGGNL